MDAPPDAAPLARDGDFLRLWVGQSVSIFGSLITRVALPLLAVYAFSPTPGEMSLLRLAELAPALALGLVAGVWVDRLRRRPLMIAADLGRALVLASIPAAAWLGTLRLEHLYVAALAVSVLSIVFDVAYRAYLPTLVGRDRLVEGNSRLQATASVAEVAGFGLAGALVQFLTAPLAVAIDAATFLVSAASLGMIRRPEPPPAPAGERAGALGEIRAGLAAVAANSLLRALATFELIRGVFQIGAFSALYLLFVADELAIEPLAMGVLFGLGGVSSLVGSLLTGPIIGRVGVARAMVGAAFLVSLGAACIPLAHGSLPVVLALLAAQQLIGDGAWTLLEIAQTSLIQSGTPERLQGRVFATFGVLALAAQLAGVMFAGLLGELIGVRGALAIGVAGSLAAALVLAASRPALEVRPAGR